ncbi:pyridine nucleotide-disulfide oxidoreductase family protein [Mycobacterium xenopi 4042]|uniref:Pyridine nucleotide-disulfide oxidoreductase family protein n=1 Tax=Mycobacterium xenopi 4042 TaxID=1299334 RepID=X7YP98_MYCXE|nr:pyridine nucleotide-disulfide oxidoreductase family protein [Mycobacterium xenopi 4042]
MTDYHTVVVGAGFSGIGAAIKLDQAGLGDYRVIEAGDGVGGTWYWNTYPGIAVDIPSFSYQFSFEQSAHWSRTYAPGHELRPMRNTASTSTGSGPRSASTPKFSPRSSTTTTTCGGCRPTPAATSPQGFGERQRCAYRAQAARHRRRGLVRRHHHAHRPLGSRPGLDRQAGRGDRHRASAVQVIPEIAPIVKHLTVFQRTPIWCFPKFDVPLPAPARWAMRLPGGKAVQRLASQAFVEATFPIPAHYFTVFPLAKRMQAAGLAYLRQQVRDPVVREKLTPRYAVGCKRPGFHNGYLATFNRDNVRLVTEPIDKITPTGVATRDGENHEIDVLVLATGFKVMDADSVPTFAVTGSGGRSLSAFWDEHRLQAYEGVSIPGSRTCFRCSVPTATSGRRTSR